MYSIDWCADREQVMVPETEGDYITFRRMTSAELRQRDSISIGKLSLGRDDPEGPDLQIRLDALRRYEWRCCIVDFRLTDTEGRVWEWKDTTHNQRVLDHVTPTLAHWIDAQIARINKVDAVGQAEVQELHPN